MNNLPLKDTDDIKMLEIFEIKDEFLHWCVEGALKTVTPDDVGYEVLKEVCEAINDDVSSVALAPARFRDDDNPWSVPEDLDEYSFYMPVRCNDAVYIIGGSSIATAILRAMKQPQWSQYDKILKKGDDLFGKGNWILDWHIARPIVDENANFAFIIQGRRK